MKKNYKGFALIEVMVAALVLTVGAIGFLKLQTIALKSSRNNFSRGQGVEIASSQIDFFRQNRLALQRPASNQQDFATLTFPAILSVATPTPPTTNISTVCQTHGTVDENQFNTACDDALRAYQQYLMQLKLAENFSPGMAIICTRFAGTFNAPIVRVDFIWRDNATYDTNVAPPNLDALTVNDCPTAINNVVNNASTTGTNTLEQLQATEKSVTVYGRL